MIPGQLIAPGQLTDPGVNFASVHGLTPVTVHMKFSLPWGNFKRRVTLCTTLGNPPCRGNFSPCKQNAKVAPPPKKNNKILKMKYLRTQSGCIIAFPGMFNHDINYT